MMGEDEHTSTYLARVVDFIGWVQTHKEDLFLSTRRELMAKAREEDDVVAQKEKIARISPRGQVREIVELTSPESLPLA